MNGIKTEPFINLTGVKTEPGLSTWAGIKSEPIQPNLTFKSEPNAAQCRTETQKHEHFENTSEHRSGSICPGSSGSTQRAPDQNSNLPEVPGFTPELLNQIDRLANVDNMGRAQIMKTLKLKSLPKKTLKKIRKRSTPTQGNFLS